MSLPRAFLYAIIIVVILYLLQINKINLFSPAEMFNTYDAATLTTPGKFTYSWNERADKRKDFKDSSLGTHNYIDNNVFEVESPGNVPVFNM
jgi:hypothetical protein